MHRHRLWAAIPIPIALAGANLTLAGGPAPAVAGQDRADLVVRVRVESPCTSTVRGNLVEQRCTTSTPTRARIESARSSPPAADGIDVSWTTLSSAGEPGHSYLTVIY